MPRELQDMVVKLSWWLRMRQPSLCHPPWPPTRLRFQQADTASEPRAKRRKVMLTGVRSTRRDMPSGGQARGSTGFQRRTVNVELEHCLHIKRVTNKLTYLGHDDGGSHAPSLPPIGQLGGITSGGEELAIAEAQ